LQKRSRTSVSWVERSKVGCQCRLSHLASPCAAALCAEVGKRHRFCVARICKASQEKKRQLCELHKVVSTCTPDVV
jgi:hypothetical protein